MISLEWWQVAIFFILGKVFSLSFFVIAISRTIMKHKSNLKQFIPNGGADHDSE